MNAIYLGDPLSVILSCRGLIRRFGDNLAVDDVSFEIAEGEAYGLLGPNGAGKTTTLSMICGLLEKHSGEILVAGVPMDSRPLETKKAIGYVPQEIALYPDLSGYENLKFWGRMYGLKGTALKSRIEEVLEVVGLTDRAKDRVSAYSGGMKRRINIAAGLLHQPDLLILDEPTVGVDPQSRNAILDNVASLNKEGMAVLYTSHYMEEVEKLCQRVGIIDSGKLIAEGTRRELVESLGQKDRVIIEATGALDHLARALSAVEGVEDVSVGEGAVELLTARGSSILPRALEAAEKSGAQISGARVIEPDLEAVFLHLTGKALRD